MKQNAKERVAAVRISGMINRSWEFEPNNTCAVQFIHELANLILIDPLMRKGLTLLHALVIEWCNYGLQHKGGNNSGRRTLWSCTVPE